MACKKLLSLTRPHVHLPLCLYCFSFLLLRHMSLSGSLPHRPRWFKRALAPVASSLVGNAIDWVHTVKTLFTHQLFTTLSVYYQGFVPSVFSRADLHFLPAHKSQTQSSQPWREPSNHQQPQKKDGGYLTPEPISMQPLGLHAHMMNATWCDRL